MPTILSIEDNILNRNLIRRYFKHTDIHLWEALTGTEGIELAKTEHPDLILLDFYLPDMTGADIVQIIRDSSELRNVPVIGLTAHDNRILHLQMLDEGFDAVLYKPVNRMSLLKTVKDHLSKAFGSY